MRTKRNLKNLLCLLLAFVMFLSASTTTLAAKKTVLESDKSSKDIIITDDGMYINGNYITKTDFVNLLENAVQTSETPTATYNNRNMAATVNAVDGSTISGLLALFAGTWEIPVVGEVVITAAGVIIVGGAIIVAGNWIYDAVTGHFENLAKAAIAEAKVKIPERLKDGNGDVNLGNFNQKVAGKNAYKEKGGWTIEKDTAGHGGRKWKLKDKAEERVASLDENGKVLSK